MNLANDLRQYLRAHDLSQERLAELVGVKQATVSRWLSGSEPKHRYKVRLAEIDERVFAKYLEAKFSPSGRIQVKGIPVVGYVQAGLFRDAVEWDEDRVYEVYAPMNFVGGGKAFALEVRGDSMNRVLPAGTIVVCRPIAESRQPAPGDIVVAYRHHHDQIEATLKEVAIDGAGKCWLWPRSTSPNHQAPFPIDSSEIEVAALVLCAISKVGNN